MICPFCGNKLPRGSRFCEYCGTKQERKKPSAGLFFKIATVVLAVCVVCLSAVLVNGYRQQSALRAEVDSLTSDISALTLKNEYLNIQLKNKMKQYSEMEKENADLRKFEEKALFLDGYIGFVVSGSNNYHTIDCRYYRNSDEYWAHNIEYCDYLGYSPCQICH